MKKTAILFLFAVTAFGLQAQTLTWDIQFHKVNDWESVPVNQIIRMETGDEYIITISPASDCYSYIVLYDSQRQLSVLNSGQLRAGTELYIGPFEITDPSGTETLYVVMSLERQTQLETLIQDFNGNPGSRQQADALRREIVNLQNEVSRLGEPPSPFITSGGTNRGSAQEYVTRFSERNKYVRSITIRH